MLPIYEQMVRISYAELLKAGRLTPGQKTIYRSNPDMDREWSIILLAEPDHVTLINTSTKKPHRINYQFSRTGYGQRRYFVCPHCRRAVGIILAHDRGFGCRLCLCTNYLSTRERPYITCGRMAKAIRVKLIILGGGVPEDDDEFAFPQKPKWMRWPTYLRLTERHVELMGKYYEGFRRANWEPRKPRGRHVAEPASNSGLDRPRAAGHLPDAPSIPAGAHCTDVPARRSAADEREALLRKAVEEYAAELEAEGKTLPVSLQHLRTAF